MNGFLNIYKPKGVTSHDVVYKIRKKIGAGIKVGHLGTLDPMAEGVLPLAIGPAVRLIEFLPPQKKTYIAEVTLGIETDTLDIEGKILQKKEPEFIEKGLLTQTLQSFLGVIKQTPPKYSAVKISGQTAYRLARKDVDFEIPERTVEVFSIELMDYNFPKFIFKAEVSAGTYIRSLSEDIGKKLNQLTTLSALTRQANGVFLLKDSLKTDDITPQELASAMIPVDKVFYFLPKLTVKKEFENKILNGMVLNLKGFRGLAQKLQFAETNACPLNFENKEKILVYDSQDTLLSISEIIIGETTEIKPVKVFNS